MTNFIRRATLEHDGRKYHALITDNGARLQTMNNRGAAVAYVMVCGVNDLFSHALTDAIAEIRKHPELYKEKVKQHVNLAERKMHRYEKLLARTLGKEKMSLWMDVQDKIQDAVLPHVEKLRLSHMQFLTRSGSKMSHTLSYVTTAYQLIHYAKSFFDTFADEMQKQTGADFFRLSFKEARLDSVRVHIREICALIGDGHYDFKADDNSQLALEIIDQRMSNIDVIENILNDKIA